MVLNEARDYECTEKCSGDEDDMNLMMHVTQKMFPKEDKATIKAEAIANSLCLTLDISHSFSRY